MLRRGVLLRRGRGGRDAVPRRHVVGRGGRDFERNLQQPMPARVLLPCRFCFADAVRGGHLVGRCERNGVVCMRGLPGGYFVWRRCDGTVIVLSRVLCVGCKLFVVHNLLGGVLCGCNRGDGVCDMPYRLLLPDKLKCASCVYMLRRSRPRGGEIVFALRDRVAFCPRVGV